jgi:hypothetical protein
MLEGINNVIKAIKEMHLGLEILTILNRTGGLSKFSISFYNRLNHV